jgi:hypothetical protein
MLVIGTYLDTRARTHEARSCSPSYSCFSTVALQPSLTQVQCCRLSNSHGFSDNSGPLSLFKTTNRRRTLRRADGGVERKKE